MDVLNFSQGMLNAPGMPVPVEPVIGQSVAALDAPLQDAFGAALLEVLDAFMVNTPQEESRIVTADGTPPISVDVDDEADVAITVDSLLRDDAQQQLLETLLMASQAPAQILNIVGQPSAPVEHAAFVISPLPQVPEFSPVRAEAVVAMSPSAAHQTLNLPAHAPVKARTESEVQHLVSSSKVSSAIAAFHLGVQQVVEGRSMGAIAQPAPTAGHVASLRMYPAESRWTQQLQSALGERLQVLVKEQIQHATIRLDPPEMGKIEIALQFENGRVQVQINASHADVYRALQQTSNDLRQSLTEQHFVQVNVQVSSQSGGQQQGKAQDFWAQQHAAIKAGSDIATSSTDTGGFRDDGSVLLTV